MRCVCSADAAGKEVVKTATKRSNGTGVVKEAGSEKKWVMEWSKGRKSGQSGIPVVNKSN